MRTLFQKRQQTIKGLYLLAFLLLVGCGYQENLPNTTRVQFNVVHDEAQTQKTSFAPSPSGVTLVTLKITGQGIEPIVRSVSAPESEGVFTVAIFELDVPKLNGLVAEIEQLDVNGTVLFRGRVTLDLENEPFGQVVRVILKLSDISSTAPPPAPTTFTLTVTNTGTGTGTVTSDPGINCGADCSEIYNTDTVVTLTATPATGSLFLGWSGHCSGTTTSTMVTMNETKSCTATFNLNSALEEG